MEHSDTKTQRLRDILNIRSYVNASDEQADKDTMNPEEIPFQ